MQMEWETLAGIGSEIKRGRLSTQKPTQVQPVLSKECYFNCKLILQALIITQLVQLNEKKNEYTPAKKEFVSRQK